MNELKVINFATHHSIRRRRRPPPALCPPQPRYQRSGASGQGSATIAILSRSGGQPDQHTSVI